MSDSGIFKNICKENDFDISDYQIRLIEKYVGLFCGWNEKINLISRKDIENIWTRHIIGSLAFLFNHSIDPKSTIVDIGTGGGLPGIPLAILLPGCRFTLVDSIRKKIIAVDDMIKSLPLSNAVTLHGRAEELSARPEYRGRFDYVIARAVGSVTDIAGWSSGFLRQNDRYTRMSDKQGDKMYIFPGSILLMKGGDLSDELTCFKKYNKNWLLEIYPMKVHGVPPEDLQDKKFVFMREGK